MNDRTAAIARARAGARETMAAWIGGRGRPCTPRPPRLIKNAGATWVEDLKNAKPATAAAHFFKAQSGFSMMLTREAAVDQQAARKLNWFDNLLTLPMPKNAMPRRAVSIPRHRGKANLPPDVREFLEWQSCQWGVNVSRLAKQWNVARTTIQRAAKRGRRKGYDKRFADPPGGEFLVPGAPFA